jgi:hypothetical protein
VASLSQTLDPAFRFRVRSPGVGGTRAGGASLPGRWDPLVGSGELGDIALEDTWIGLRKMATEAA